MNAKDARRSTKVLHPVATGKIVFVNEPARHGRVRSNPRRPKPPRTRDQRAPCTLPPRAARRETSVGFMSSVVAARKLLRLCTCRWRGEDRERAGQDAPLKPLTSAPPPTHNELTVRLMSQPSRLSLCPKRCGRAHAAGLLMVLIHTPRPAPPRWRGARTTGRGVVYDRGRDFGHTPSKG